MLVGRIGSDRSCAVARRRTGGPPLSRRPCIVSSSTCAAIGAGPAARLWRLDLNGIAHGLDPRSLALSFHGSCARTSRTSWPITTLPAGQRPLAASPPANASAKSGHQRRIVSSSTRSTNAGIEHLRQPDLIEESTRKRTGQGKGDRQSAKTGRLTRAKTAMAAENDEGHPCPRRHSLLHETRHHGQRRIAVQERPALPSGRGRSALHPIRAQRPHRRLPAMSMSKSARTRQPICWGTQFAWKRLFIYGA